MENSAQKLTDANTFLKPWTFFSKKCEHILKFEQTFETWAIIEKMNKIFEIPKKIFFWKYTSNILYYMQNNF